MPEDRPETNTETLAQVLADHAALLWGAEKAAQLQPLLEQAARMLREIGENLPGANSEPSCYPAAE